MSNVRNNILKALVKQAEEKELLKSLAEDEDLNNNVDNPKDYADKFFDKLLHHFKIEGLED